MRKFLILLDRELKAYFYSPIAYVVLCFFLALTGFDLYAMLPSSTARRWTSRSSSCSSTTASSGSRSS